MTENGDPFTSYQWIQNSVGTNNSKNSDIQIEIKTNNCEDT